MVSASFSEIATTLITGVGVVTVASAAAVENYRRIPRFAGSAVSASYRRLPASTTTLLTTARGSSRPTESSPLNVATAGVLLATDSSDAAAIGLDPFARAPAGGGTPDRSRGTANGGANGGPNITTTNRPMEEDPPKLILYIVLPVCLAVIAFVLVAVAVRCIRRRKAANQARNETPDLWIRNSQELPLYAVDCTLPPSQPEVPISPKTDLSTICEVLQTYVPQSPRELQLVKGEFLKIVEKDPKGWCRGVIGTHVGWFPGSFVKEIRTASLIEASDDEAEEEETIAPERLKPRVSSFMIKKRVIRTGENGQLPNDDESRILSRSHSEFGDIISLPRSRASTAGSSIYDDPEYVRFHQRSPACRLSIPDRFRNGSIDLRLGPPLLNSADNPYPISRRMYPRRSEPISLLLQVPPSSRSNPPRPTRPAPPPPPSRKSAVITSTTSTIAPSITTSTSIDSSAGVSGATSPSSTSMSEASATLTVPTTLLTQNSAPAQLEVSDPMPAPIQISAPVPIHIPITTQNLIPVQNFEAKVQGQILAPTPDPVSVPVSLQVPEQITPPASVHSSDSDQASVETSIPMRDKRLDSIPNEKPVPIPVVTQTPAQISAPIQVLTPAPAPAPASIPISAKVPPPAPAQAPPPAPAQAPPPAPAQAPPPAPSQAPPPAPVQTPEPIQTQAQAPPPAPVQTPSLAPSLAPSQVPAPAPAQAPVQAVTPAPAQPPSQDPLPVPALPSPPPQFQVPAQIAPPAPAAIPAPTATPAPTQPPSQSPSPDQALPSPPPQFKAPAPDLTPQPVPGPIQTPIIAQSPVPVQPPVELKPTPLALIVLRSPKSPVKGPQIRAEPPATETLEVKQKTPPPPPVQPKPTPPAVQPKPVIRPHHQPPSVPPPQPPVQLVNQPELQQNTQQLQE